jgi:hypothetical protein
MGVRADVNGISVQFVDKNNVATEAPIFGRFAHLRGVDRSEVLRCDPLRPGESEGSEHWMTLLAVADSKERLDKIVSTSKAAEGSIDTSSASHRVMVEIHVGKRRETLEGRTVIASGPIVSFDPPEVNVVHVKVLPENAIVREGSPVGKELGRSPIEKEFIGMKPLSARGILAVADSLHEAETARVTAAANAAKAEAAEPVGSPTK